jgi:methylthioribulose 1-phosphate dehydratase/enolase-phosphatase E1
MTSTTFAGLCRSYLEATYESPETQEDLALLREQAHADTAAGLTVPPIPSASQGRDAVIVAAVANCEAQMDSDRKTTALKSLQVRHHGPSHRFRGNGG